MARKTKVEKSPHYKEIVNLLLQGQSLRDISTYLKREYEEDISPSAIYTFKKKHLDIESEVKIRELTKRKLDDKQEEQKQEAILEHAETESDVEVAKEEAIHKLTQALHVLEFFFGTYGEEAVITLMKDAEVKSDSKLNLLLRAIKYYLDFYKDDKPECNITTPTFHDLMNTDLLMELTDDEYTGDTQTDKDSTK